MARSKTPRIKRRKEVRKEETVRIRVTTEQKETLTEAATQAGLSLSSWLLAVGLRAAQGRQAIG
jgi:uncharacterized protein (DUF1778 family)